MGTLRRLWNRFVNRREVPRQAPRVDSRAMQRYMQHYEQRVGQLANDLASGDLTPLQWQDAMEREISSLHLTADAIGSGGLQNMTREGLDRVNAQVREQTAYLRHWREQMETGQFPTDNADRIRQRGLTYAQNADVTLNKAALKIRGIPDLPAQPKDGSTSCLYNCYCTWRIVEVGAARGDYNAFWVMDPIRDNCPECQARARAWSPLEIRGGVVNQQQVNQPGLYT